MKSAKKTSSRNSRRAGDADAAGLPAHASSAPIRRGTVAALSGTGEVLVQVGRGTDARDVACDVLQAASGPGLELNVGDPVLVMLPEIDGEPGCVIGRTGPYRRPDREKVRIEAERELVLRCGDASITLRHDGKVLTRADDVATVARRRNRIKGGSVDIN